MCQATTLFFFSKFFLKITATPNTQNLPFKSVLTSKKVKSKTLIKLRIREPRTAIETTTSLEFGNIDYLHPTVTDNLNKNRNDLREAIYKTLRVQQAFIKRLTKQAPHSNRIKHIIRLTEDLSTLCDLQRDIIEKKISRVLTYKQENK